MTDRRTELIEAMAKALHDKYDSLQKPWAEIRHTPKKEAYRRQARCASDAQLQYLVSHPDPNERALGEMIKRKCEAVKCRRCKGRPDAWGCEDCNGSGTLYRVKHLEENQKESTE